MFWPKWWSVGCYLYESLIPRLCPPNIFVSSLLNNHWQIIITESDPEELYFKPTTVRWSRLCLHLQHRTECAMEHSGSRINGIQGRYENLWEFLSWCMTWLESWKQSIYGTIGAHKLSSKKSVLAKMSQNLEYSSLSGKKCSLYLGSVGWKRLRAKLLESLNDSSIPFNRPRAWVGQK